MGCRKYCEYLTEAGLQNSMTSSQIHRDHCRSVHARSGPCRYRYTDIIQIQIRYRYWRIGMYAAEHRIYSHTTKLCSSNLGHETTSPTPPHDAASIARHKRAMNLSSCGSQNSPIQFAQVWLSPTMSLARCGTIESNSGKQLISVDGEQRVEDVCDPGDDERVLVVLIDQLLLHLLRTAAAGGRGEGQRDGSAWEALVGGGQGHGSAHAC